MPPKHKDPMIPVTYANIAKRQGPYEPNDDDVKYNVLLLLKKVALSIVSGQKPLMSASESLKSDIAKMQKMGMNT